MTAALAPLASASTRGRVAAIARAIEPILKRVVLAGPPVIGLLMNDPTIHRPSITFAADSTLRLLSTSMIDRLGIDLQRLGHTRTARTPSGDRWRLSGEHSIDLVQVHADEGDSAQVWLEYATLLTLPLSIDDSTTVRIAGAPAMLALECSTLATAGGPIADSEEAERIVTLVAGRVEIERECAAAPPELRTFLTNALGRLANSDALQFVIERALPDAAIFPALAHRVQAKLRRIAGC